MITKVRKSLKLSPTAPSARSSEPIYPRTAIRIPSPISSAPNAITTNLLLHLVNYGTDQYPQYIHKKKPIKQSIKLSSAKIVAIGGANLCCILKVQLLI